MKILGILNVTADSFSDGGKYLAPDAALAHADALARDGADIIDIGAASSHPGAQPVAPDAEIARLASVVPALKARGLPLSIDSFVPEVQRWALGAGVDYLNDIHGFPDAALYPDLAASNAKLIVMHAVQARGIATRQDVPPQEIFGRVMAFFEARIAALVRGGVARERLILDPGMGFFLGTDPENSYILLARFPELKKAHRLPVLLSVSRKSFLRRAAKDDAGMLRDLTAAAEAGAVLRGADYIRTHEPGPFLKALENMEKTAR